MRSYLYELSDAKHKMITREIGNIRTVLSKPPATLQSYVEYVNRLEVVNGQLEDMRQEKKILEDMKAALSKYKGKDQQYPNVQQSQLQNKIEQIHNDITDTQIKIDQQEQEVVSRKEENVVELAQKIEEEQGKVQGLIEEVLTSEALIRADTPTKEALEKASKIKKNYDDRVKKLAQYKQYQETLKLEITDIPEIDQFEVKFNFRHRLWTIRHVFADQKKHWYRDNFREQNAAEICQTVKERESELIKLKAKYCRDQKDEVLEQAQAEIKDVSRHSNLIAALGQKAMQEKHWQKIWALVDGTPAVRQSFPLKSLLDAGIDAHFDEVEIISAFAAGE